ncbi:MAG: hypothetical protein ACK5V5_11835 [Cyclobacteriaceae bacterium]|jgi:hypothetical protein|nr:hypothetical protein [Flammeovirgaceae bacterium]HAC25378.1 hypothetical protein [Cytophagales bacterium]
MSKDLLIKKTVDHLARLPETEVKQVSEFAEFLLRKLDDRLLNEGIEQFISGSSGYKFLQDEEDIYTVNDLRERYK